MTAIPGIKLENSVALTDRLARAGQSITPGFLEALGGTVALRETDAESARIAILNEHQVRYARVFTVHFNTGFSAHLITFVERCGSMQQCPLSSV